MNLFGLTAANGLVDWYRSGCPVWVVDRRLSLMGLLCLTSLSAVARCSNAAISLEFRGDDIPGLLMSPMLVAFLSGEFACEYIPRLPPKVVPVELVVGPSLGGLVTPAEKFEADVCGRLFRKLDGFRLLIVDEKESECLGFVGGVKRLVFPLFLVCDWAL